jgi:hypothetical protein
MEHGENNIKLVRKFPFFFGTSPNVVIEWLKLLLRIRKVAGSNLGQSVRAPIKYICPSHPGHTPTGGQSIDAFRYFTWRCFICCTYRKSAFLWHSEARDSTCPSLSA